MREGTENRIVFVPFISSTDHFSFYIETCLSYATHVVTAIKHFSFYVICSLCILSFLSCAEACHMSVWDTCLYGN